MNYFNRNRLITIFLVALMMINIAALATIAARSRIFVPKNNPPVEISNNREPIPNREREKRFAEIMSKKLGLTEEQETGMKELWEANQAKMKPIMQQMDETRLKINDAFGSRELNLERIEVLNDSVAFLDKQIRDNLLEYNIKVRELLSDDQLEKYLEMHKKMRRSRGGSKHVAPPMEMIQIF